MSNATPVTEADRAVRFFLLQNLHRIVHGADLVGIDDAEAVDAAFVGEEIGEHRRPFLLVLRARALVVERADDAALDVAFLHPFRHRVEADRRDGHGMDVGVDELYV